MAHLLHGTMPWLVILIVLAALGGLAANRGEPARFKRREMMTAAEIAFWHILRDAVTPWHVAPQVSMGALLSSVASSRAERQGACNRFSQKMVDFVLLDEDGHVRLLVELDDRSHKPERDAKRDRMTTMAGYKTFRVTGKLTRDPVALRTALDAAL